jgi:hypothetical protein
MIHQQVQRGGLALESRKKKQRPKAVEPLRSVPPPPTQRGFFCSTSIATPTAGSTSIATPTAGVCVRAKPDCVRTRDSLTVAVGDLSECTLVESAWCVQIAAGDDRCFPAEDVCGAAVVRLGASAECREVR